MARRVLVVADNSTIRALIAYSLGLENYDVIETANPSDAIERLKDGSLIPDIVIISLDIYEADTCGLIKSLRGYPCLRHKPILTVADRDMLDKQMDWRMAGGTFWIERPFSGSDIVRAVEMLLF